MNKDTDLIYETKQKMLIKYPRFGSEIATSKIEFRDNLKYHTAATDGKNVYVDPNYFASLSEDDRLFLIAHEILHIKFMHPLRLKDKNGNMRNMDVWNEACDAIINANLERDGFTIKEGYVNRPEAIHYTAEEFYQLLLKEREEERRKQEEQGKENSQNSENQEKGQDNQENSDDQTTEQQANQNEDTNTTERNSSSTNSEENSNDEMTEEGTSKTFSDDHSMWEEAFKEQNRKEEKSEEKAKSNSDKKKAEFNENHQETSQIEESDAQFGFDERQEFDENRREKIERYKAKRDKANRQIRTSRDKETIGFGNVGKGTNGIDWKLLIRKAVESNQTVWSQRRSIAENNYAYRLEENETEEEATTEVMIDVSGSVQLELVKSFLRELKPLLKESALKVGCFNAEFWGMVDIKSEKDIDNFTIPKAARGHAAWTEDWDLAVRSFNKDRRVNKIVFTDGWPGPGNMPKNDLKGENVIWLVYGNENFRPCCGKVINVNERQIRKMYQQYDGFER